MTIYMIRGETVTAHAAAPAKPPKGSLTIRSAGDIASSDLPASRLVAIWNALTRRSMTDGPGYSGKRCNRRCDGGRDDRPDAWNGRQALTDRVALVPSHDLPLDDSDPCLEVVELVGD